MEVIRGFLKLQRHSSKETAGHNTLLKIWWKKFATSHTCRCFEKVMGTRFIHCHLMPVITITRTSLHVGEFVLSIWLSKIMYSSPNMTITGESTGMKTSTDIGGNVLWKRNWEDFYGRYWLVDFSRKGAAESLFL